MSQLRGRIVDHMMSMTEELVFRWGTPSVQRRGQTVAYETLQDYCTGEKPKEVGTFATQ